MTTILPTTEIKLLVRYNPHRRGSMDARRFEIIRNLQVSFGQVFVGQYLDAHERDGTVLTEWNAKRYLRYMVDRGQMELVGVTFAPRQARAPRDRAPANVLAIAPGLDEFTFGVELECILPRGMAVQEVADQVVAAGVDCRIDHYGHSTRTWWKIVTDGSLGDYTRGREFVSPVLRGQDGLRQVETVCRKLMSLGVTVNKNCGLHIHVGNAARNEDVAYFDRLLRLYSYNEGAIDAMMPLSRRNSHWCAPVRVARGEHRSVGELCRSIGCSGQRSSARYRKLNVDCWWSQRTVEFRQHSGSIEADKVCNWVQFCLAFARFAASNEAVPANVPLNEFLASISLSSELQAYYNRRSVEIAERIARTMARAA